MLPRPPDPLRRLATLKLTLFSLGCSFICGCTALDTTAAGDKKVDERKPHVGRYYMLPKALITIEGHPDTDGNLLLDASTSLVADRRHRYFLRWKPNPFYEDIFNNVDVDSDGMLTSVNYSAEDKTPQILSDLVSSTINVAKIAKDLGYGLDVVASHAPFKYTFDPFDAAEVGQVKHDLLTKQSFELQVAPRARGGRTELANEIDASVRQHERAVDPQHGGLFYHPPTTFEMLLIDHNGEKAKAKAQKAASALIANSPTPAPGKGTTPNAPEGNNSTPKPSNPPSPIDTAQPTTQPATLCHIVMTVPNVDEVACMQQGRSFLTKREANLGFAHGMPTTFVFKQPSGIQAVTGILSSLSGTVSTAIPSLINVKSTSTSTQKPTTPTVIPASANAAASTHVTQRTPLTAETGQTLPGPSNQDLQNTINALNHLHQNDTARMGKLRQSLIDSLESAGKTTDEINEILKEDGLAPMQ